MSDRNDREGASHGYEHTPGVEKGTQGTVLDPTMGGDPVTAEDITPGPTARGDAANAGGLAGSTAGATNIQTVAGVGAVGGAASDVSASVGGHDGLGAGIDQDANVGGPGTDLTDNVGSRLRRAPGETGGA